MKSLILMVLISLLSLNAYAYDFIVSDVVKLQSDLGELDIQASAHSSGALTYVIVKNDSMQKVFCEARFRNGPELPKLGLSSAEVEPSATAYLKYMPKRSAVVIKANLKCGPS
jgi:hypothetical protein